MDTKTFTAPLIAAAEDPVIVTAVVFVGLMTLATWLQHRKSQQLQQFGNWIAMGGGLAYKFMALRAATGGTALTAAGIAALEQQAIGQGVAAIKDAAAKDAGKLPDDATLAAHVGGSLGTLLAADPTVSAVGAAVATAITPAGGSATALAAA